MRKSHKTVSILFQVALNKEFSIPLEKLEIIMILRLFRY